MGLAELKLRWKALIRSRAFERDVEDEVVFHLAMREQRLRERGADAIAAQCEAHRRFGNTTQVGETLREMRGWRVLEWLWQDLRFALRQLRVNPGFAAGAILPLALAIGCTAAVLTLVDAVLFRPTGVHNPSRLAAIYTFSRTQTRYLSDSYPDFRDIGELSGFVDSTAAYVRLPISVRLTDGAERMNTELVTGHYFRAAGIAPALGRPLVPEDDRPGAPPVALVSYSLWETRYARSSSILGTVAWFNGVPFTIVGVMPQSYQGMLLDWNDDLSFWAPLTQFRRLFPGSSEYENRREAQMLMMLARLRPGVSLPQLQAALDVLATRVAASPDYRFIALPSDEARFWPAYRAATVRFLWMLIAVSAAAVAIACFNLAGLLLARVAARQQEISTRLAVGASRARLLEQFIVENAVLAVCACAFSIPVTMGVTHWLRTAQITRGFNLALNLSADWRALGIGMLAGLVTAILAGVVPALKGSRGDLALGLKSGQTRRATLRDLFVTAQITGAMTILVPAALMTQSLRDLSRVHIGYDARGVLIASLGNYGAATPDRVDPLIRALLTQMRLQAPGAAVASQALPTTTRMMLDVSTDVGTSASAWTPASFNWVSGGYFELLRIPILSGRSILDTDDRRSQPVVIINQSAALMLWPGENPVGRHLRLRSQTTECEVIGVVEDVRVRPLGAPEAAEPYLFLPLFQKAVPADLEIHVRTPGQPLQFARTLRQIAAQVAPDAALSEIRTLEDQVGAGLRLMQTAAEATGAVSLLGIILAVAGMFASSAYRVTQQKKEIAIRIAIGAEPRRVIRSFASRGLWIGITGACLGLLPAAWGAGFLRASVTGAEAAEAWLFAVVGLVLGLVSAGAAFAAARRIARVQPADVLRVQ